MFTKISTNDRINMTPIDEHSIANSRPRFNLQFEEINAYEESNT